MSTEFNPYRAPQAAVDLPADQHEPAEIASKGRRFGTLVVDYLGYFAASFVIGIVMAALHLHLPRGSELFNFAFGMVVLVTYYLVFEGFWGRTPGKFVFGTVVVDMKGGKPAFATLLGRTLCRFIPFEPFSFFGAAGWHDKFSKTRVVRKR